MVSFADIINKHGPIDLIKMDCEGAEWEFLNDQAWNKVSYLTMEYHLEKNSFQKNKNMLYQALKNHFFILKDQPIDELTGIILASNKKLC